MGRNRCPSAAGRASAVAFTMKVTVYFVIREGVCEIATSEKRKATEFIESFNRHRVVGAKPVELKELEVEVT